MLRACFKIPSLGALGLVAACAANGDPPPGSTVPNGAPPGGVQATAPATSVPTSLDTRDVAILVVSQTPTALQVISSNSRPRSSFGPAAGWNGTGTPTHRWVLRNAHGEVLAAGDIVVRSTLEAPPNPAKGAPAAHVEQEQFAFDLKVPKPAPGESIEITSLRAAGLVARWP